MDETTLNHLLETYGIADWVILHGYRGSVSHGTFEPSSKHNSIDDIDTMAVVVPPQDHYYGLSEFGSRGTVEIKEGEWDVVAYEARKMVQMLVRGNPNVLALLWLPENLYLKRTVAGQLLIDNRDLFVGKHLYESFAGYAAQQLEKMQKLAFQGYMGEKRRRLVEQHGYDTKNAAHAIRLMRECIEFLGSGSMQVQREDAAELLEIKHGRWSLEKVKAEAANLAERAKQAVIESPLPKQVDADAANRLCVQIVRTELESREAVAPTA